MAGKWYEGEKIVVYGCGGHARSIINIIREVSERIEIILVDEYAERNEVILGCRAEREYELNEKDAYIIAVGDNQKRANLYQALHDKDMGHCISIFSKNSSVGMDAKIGQGSFIASGAYIGPQAVIGNNTIINTGSIIEHEVRIGDNSHIAPHATVCGRTKIGNHVFCGAGSTVIDSVSICDHVIIGAGAVVVKDIKESGTYLGVPAKRIG